MSSVNEYASTKLGELRIADYITALVSSWTEVGESPESQLGFVDDLSTSLRESLDRAVQTAAKRKADLADLVNHKVDGVASLKSVLAGAIDTTVAAYDLPNPRELTLIQQLTALESTESQLTEVRTLWIEKLSAKRDRAAGMCELLGLPFDDKLRDIGPLTPARLEIYDKHIAFLAQTQTERKQVIVECKASILQYWKILETVPTTHLEKSIADPGCDLGVHNEVIEALQQMKADLNVEYQNREAETAELGAEIQRLWNLLQIDEKFQQ
jgi:hypothetical protein